MVLDGSGGIRRSSAYPKLELLVPGLLHAGFGALGVLPVVHLDESMALVLVDDASLDVSKAVEDLAQFVF